jgi:hypothetical protein
LKKVLKKSFLYLGGLINQIEPGSIWFNDFSSSKRNMWNETETFWPKFILKIQNRLKFEMRWKLFCFLNSYKMFWPFQTKRNEINNLAFIRLQNIPAMKTWEMMSFNYGSYHSMLSFMRKYFNDTGRISILVFMLG